MRVRWGPGGLPARGKTRSKGGFRGRNGRIRAPMTPFADPAEPVLGARTHLGAVRASRAGGGSVRRRRRSIRRGRAASRAPIFGTFLSKTIWRPLTNLPVARRPIGTRNPVTLPAGFHPVAGPTTHTLPVGTRRQPPKGTKKRRQRTRPPPDAVVSQVHTMEEKGSDVNLAVHLLQRRLEEVVRRRRCRLERYRPRHAHSDRDCRAGHARVCGVPQRKADGRSIGGRRHS